MFWFFIGNYIYLSYFQEMSEVFDSKPIVQQPVHEKVIEVTVSTKGKNNRKFTIV